MGPPKEDYIEIDLGRILSAMWRRAWVIVLAMVLTGGAAFFYAYRCIPARYQASALMYVNNSSFSLGGTSISLSDLSASKTLVNSYIAILKTRQTMGEVIERSGVSYSCEELSGMVSAASVNATEIFKINVTAPDPAEAALIANTIVEVLPDKIAGIISGSSVRVVDYAVPPSAKASPNLTACAMAGAALGFLVSCLALFLKELLDDQVHDEGYLLQTYGLPILAVVPELQERGDRRGRRTEDGA